MAKKDKKHMSTRIEKAQGAFKKKDVSMSIAAHSSQAIKLSNEQHQKEKGKYLGDLVYGALDGIVTTFAVVSGVQGASLSSGVVLILGFANLFGDGISMALGNFLSTRSEIDYIKRERQREEWEVDHIPEGEREEIRQIYAAKGFRGDDLDRAVNVITSDKKVWVDTMMHEELNLGSEDKTPVKSALATFIAFVIAGLIPLLAFIFLLMFPEMTFNTFLVSAAATGVALFAVGAMRTYLTGLVWYRSGIEMLCVGGAAAAVAYLIGYLLRGLGL